MRSKFREFRVLKKVAKTIAREKKESEKIKQIVRKQNMDSKSPESRARCYM